MAGWIGGETTRPRWKQSWAEKTLASGSGTPVPLLVFIALALILLSYSYNSHSNAKMRQSLIDFQLYVFVVLVVIILYVYMTSGATADRAPLVSWRQPQQWDWTPFWLAAAVVALLLLVSYQNYLRSGWF